MSIYKKIAIIFRTPLAALFAIFVSTGLIGGIIAVPTFLIIFIGFLLACTIMVSHPSIDHALLVFLLFLPIELLLSLPDARFQPWSRLLLFITMMLPVSPLLQSKYARICRYNALRLLMLIIIVLSIASFFAYFLGVNMMVLYDSNEYLTYYGRFSGFYKHSMQLGPMSSLACLYLLYENFVTRNRWYLIPAALCAICVMFSASRGSFVGLIASAFFLLCKYSKNKIQLIKYCIVAIFLIAVTYPVWKGAMSGLEQKQQENIEAGGMMVSREEKWNCRISEFKSSPIWGVGFSSIDPEGIDYWDTDTGQIEPGSSWLAILSMTGLVGFVLFMNIFIRACSMVKCKNSEAGILFAFLAFFAIHAMSEGYIFAAGGPVCILFWLVIACCIDLRYGCKVGLKKKV